MEAPRETAVEWFARGRALGLARERERAAEFAAADFAATARAFDGILRASLRTHPPSPDSLRIGQQRLFRRLRS